MRRTTIPAAVVPPALVVPDGVASLTVAGAAWTAVNRAIFLRFPVPAAATYRYLNVEVTAASGNIQYGLVRLSGTNRTAFTRVADSGGVASPTAASQRLGFGATALTPGDYAAFLWADNTTFGVRSGTSAALTTLRVAGNATLVGGVPASGTLAWGSVYFHCSVEADV